MKRNRKQRKQKKQNKFGITEEEILFIDKCNECGVMNIVTQKPKSKLKICINCEKKQ